MPQVDKPGGHMQRKPLQDPMTKRRVVVQLCTPVFDFTPQNKVDDTLPVARPE